MSSREELRKKWKKREFSDNYTSFDEKASNPNIGKESMWNQTLTRANQFEQSFGNKALYVGKRAGSGVVGGVTGIGQSAITDTANQLRKGENESTGVALTKLVNSFTNPMPLDITQGFDTIRENLAILRDKDKNLLQKGAEIAQNTASDSLNSLPFKAKTNAVIQAIGHFLKNKQTTNGEDYGFAEDYGAEEAGNIDINNRKIKRNNDGSISTEKSITIGVEEDGREKYFVIPTIIDGKEVTEKEAEDHFFKTHEHLGVFSDENKAEKYAEDLHKRQEEFYSKNTNLSDKVLDLNDVISKPNDYIKEKLYEEGQNYDKVTQFLGQGAEVVGNMLPSVGVSMATGNPTAGLLTMGMSAKGQSTTEMLRRGEDLEKAVQRGDTDAMIEVGTEMLTGGLNIFGKGALDDIGESVVRSVKPEVARFFVKQGINMTGEALEEVISDILGTLLDKGTIDPNAKYTLKDFGNTIATTILSTSVLNILTAGLAGGGDIRQAKNRNALRETINKLEDTSDIQKENLMQKVQDERITTIEDLDREVTKQTIVNESKLSEERKDAISKFAEKYNLDANQIEDLVKTDQERFGQKENKQNIEKNQQTHENQSTILADKRLLEAKQQTTQEETKKPQNLLSGDWEADAKNINEEFAKGTDLMKDLDKYFKDNNITSTTTENQIKEVDKIIDDVQEFTDEDKKMFKSVIRTELNSGKTLEEATELVKHYEEVAKEDARQEFIKEDKARLSPINSNDKGRQKLIAQKHSELNDNPNYNNEEVIKLDETTPKNRNGKRTVKQWKDMAKELGRRIANMSPNEIEDIAVKSFYDLGVLEKDTNGKLLKITRYDNETKSRAKFDQLYANDWVNEVMKGVQESRNYDTLTEQKKETQKVKLGEREAQYKQLSIEGYNQPSGGSLIDSIWKRYEERKQQTQERLKKEGQKVQVKAKKFTKEFVNKGYVDLNGKEVNSLEELADIAQIFRNPKYETFRIIYVKGNKIVGQEAVSSRMPRHNRYVSNKGYKKQKPS